MATEPIKTPCVAICQMGKGDLYCIGCSRTRGEIEAWTRLSEEDRELIMEILKDRRLDHAED
jgi:uncharacterized protein